MEGPAVLAFVYSRRVRWTALGFVAAAALVLAVVGAQADGPAAYLTVWSASGFVLVVPAVLLAPRALREVDPATHPLRALYAANVVLFVACALVYLVGAGGWTAGRPLLVVLAVIGITAFGFANGAALQQQSGQRAMLVDLIDLLVATAAILGPIALLAAEPILTSDNAWLTVPAAMVVAGGLHAVGAATLTNLRLTPVDPLQATAMVGLCVATLLDAVAQIGQGLTDFGLPPGPLVGLHVLTMSGALLLGALARRGTYRGLDRFPPQRQVRKNGPLAALIVVSVAVTSGEVAWRRDEAWVVLTGTGLLAVLALGSVLRQVMLARETTRLYGIVERAAEERLRMLAEVLRYIDGDRTRAAAQLHRQAVVLYTTMALSQPAGAGRGRTDLAAQQVDAAHHVLAALHTPGAPPGLERLAGLVRAYVGTLYGDAAAPPLEIDISDGLVVDWLDEAVAFRIVQLAAQNVALHAQARTIVVRLEEQDGVLVVEVVDDGVGFDQAATTTTTSTSTSTSGTGTGTGTGIGIGIGIAGPGRPGRRARRHRQRPRARHPGHGGALRLRRPGTDARRAAAPAAGQRRQATAISQVTLHADSPSTVPANTCSRFATPHPRMPLLVSTTSAASPPPAATMLATSAASGARAATTARATSASPVAHRSWNRRR